MYSCFTKVVTSLKFHLLTCVLEEFLVFSMVVTFSCIFCTNQSLKTYKLVTDSLMYITQDRLFRYS